MTVSDFITTIENCTIAIECTSLVEMVVQDESKCSQDAYSKGYDTAFSVGLSDEICSKGLVRDGPALFSEIAKRKYEYYLWARTASMCCCTSLVLFVIKSTRALCRVVDKHCLIFLGEVSGVGNDINPRMCPFARILDVYALRFTISTTSSYLHSFVKLSISLFKNSA